MGSKKQVLSQTLELLNDAPAQCLMALGMGLGDDRVISGIAQSSAADFKVQRGEEGMTLKISLP